MWREYIYTTQNEFGKYYTGDENRVLCFLKYCYLLGIANSVSIFSLNLSKNLNKKFL